MQQVVQIDLPVPLRIGRERQRDPRQLARQRRAFRLLLIEQRLIDREAVRRRLVERLARRLGLIGAEGHAAALSVGGGLRRHMLRLGNVELPVEDRIARRILVHVGGAVPDPLPRHEDRQLHMQLDLAHLEGRRMRVAQQVADQPAVVSRRLRPAAIADPRRLHDGRVVAHIVDHAHETVIEHRDRLEQPLLQPRRDGATGGRGVGARLCDLGLLFGRQRHMVVLGRVRHGDSPL
jgi:hypothetical protein